MSDTFATTWIVAHQAPVSMGFPSQEYCSGLPFPSPRDLPDSGIELMSPALAGRFFITEPPGKPQTQARLPSNFPLAYIGPTERARFLQLLNSESKLRKCRP